MSWIRVMVANYLTSSGKEWSDTFSKQNGGTYNNRAQKETVTTRAETLGLVGHF